MCRLAALCTTLTLALSGCAAKPLLSPHPEDDRLQVVATTNVIADIAAQVGGEHVQVASLVPPGADPHSYEPTLRDVRNIVYADVAFSNYVLLEEHKLIKTLDSNISPQAANVALAEGAAKYAAEVIPLVEDVSLDTIWLGLRVHGDGSRFGADRTSDMHLRLTGFSGPGTMHGFLTEGLGQTSMYFDTSNGVDPSEDEAVLPANAHTHLSWAFSAPGVYTATFAGSVRPEADGPQKRVGEATFTFVVGQDPAQIPELAGRQRLGGGHADVTMNLDDRVMEIVYDDTSGGTVEHRHIPASDAVIEVTNKAWQEIPSGAGFLGPKGTSVHLLPQAVLGKHVHGEIDPHLWHSVTNAIAYAKLIRDTFIAADPEHRDEYHAAAEAYIDRLDALDDEVRQTIAEIPESRRHLVTTHDAFAYRAKDYDIPVAGFVTPNPSTEPSISDMVRLTDTVRNLKVPAVFLEPQLAGRAQTLRELASVTGIDVCPIYSDAFDDTVTTYEELMRFNARSLTRCLS